MSNKVVLYLSLPLAFILVVVSSFGLFTEDFYAAESPNWQLQSKGQDMVDLFLILPVLLISSVMLLMKKSWAVPIWAGTILFLVYTFVLYCFDVHFNILFVPYCLGLGLSFYAFMYFLFMNIQSYKVLPSDKNSLNRFSGIYFIAIAFVFCLLWLSEIIPAQLQGKIPKSLAEAGLFTNGVHVLDLSIVLPATFICGIWLLKGKSLGYRLAPVFLTFFVLMNICIGALGVLLKQNGMAENYILTLIMGFLALFSFILLLLFLKRKSSANQKDGFCGA